MKENQVQNQGMIVFNQYRIMEKIGSGAFGDIYIAINEAINNQVVAIKMESVKARFPQLLFQARLLQHLHREEVKEGLPQVYASGIENGYNLMLMDLLGKSLEHHFVQNNKKFSLQTVLMLGLQLLDRIQILHKCGYIHRDIKPDNIMMGNKDKSHVVYIIDLGLSKRYVNDQNQHIYMKKGNQIIGTLRYASISNHKGMEQSRRDDLESLAYVLIYFLIGSLPWQSIKADSIKTKMEMIKNRKISISPQILCKGHPSQLAKFLAYSRGLKFEQKPNYDYLRNLLKEAGEVNNLVLDGKFDWEVEGQILCPEE